MIVNDASRVVSEGCHNLEHHSRVVKYGRRGVIYNQEVYSTDITYGEHQWNSALKKFKQLFELQHLLLLRDIFSTPELI
jgi:hypothetical protein